MFPEDGRFISIQLDVDPCIHGGDPLDQKTAGRRTDSFSALYSKLMLFCLLYITIKTRRSASLNVPVNGHNHHMAVWSWSNK